MLNYSRTKWGQQRNLWQLFTCPELSRKEKERRFKLFLILVEGLIKSVFFSGQPNKPKKRKIHQTETACLNDGDSGRGPG